jgi:hypothetical protein
MTFPSTTTVIMEHLNQLFSRLTNLTDDMNWNPSKEKESLAEAIAFAESIVRQEVVVPLLFLLQRVQLDPETRQPLSSNTPETLKVGKRAFLFLSKLYQVAEARLGQAGWYPTTKAATGAGCIIYRHCETREESEEPILPGISWEGSLMQSLPTLISPGVIGQHDMRRVCWLAHVVNWQPAEEEVGTDGETGEEGEKGEKGEKGEIGEAGEAEETEETGATGETEEADNVLLSSLSAACRDRSVSVFDVLTVEASNAVGGTRMVSLRQMTIGPWRGLHQFIETEVDVSKEIGESLEAWYTVSLLGATLMSMEAESSSSSSVPSPTPRVLVLGLGGGSIPSFLARHAPMANVEVVELSRSVAVAAQQMFGVECDILPKKTKKETNKRRRWTATADGEAVPLKKSKALPSARSRRQRQRQQQSGTQLPQQARPWTRKRRTEEKTKESKENNPRRKTPVHIADAGDFVMNAAEAGQTFDAVIVDVYTSERFPPSLLSKKFFESLRCLAGKHGVVALNAGCSDDPQHATVLALMEGAFSGGGATAASSLLVVTEIAELNETKGETRSYESAVLIGKMGTGNMADSSLLRAERWKELEEREGGDKRSAVDLSALPFRLAEVHVLQQDQAFFHQHLEWRQLLWQDNEKSSKVRRKRTKEVKMVAKDDVAWSLFGDEEEESSSSDESEESD